MKALPNICRLLLLGIVFLAGLTLYLWSQHPDSIDWLDEKINRRYQKSTHARLHDARAHAAKDPDRAIRELESLVDDLSEIQLGDHLQGAKSDALKELTSLLMKHGPTDRAILRLDEWCEFQDKNLTIRLKRAQFRLSLDDAQKEIGLGELAEIHGLAPDDPRYLWARITGLRTLNRSSDVASAFVDYLDLDGDPFDTGLTVEDRWLCFYDTGKGFTSKDHKIIQDVRLDNGRLALAVSLPAGLKKVRIDLPAGSRIRLLDLALEVVDGETVHRHTIEELSPKTHQMAYAFEILSSHGDPDPYFFFAMPAAAARKQTTLRISARLEASVPDWLADLLTSPEMHYVDRALITRSEPRLTNALAEIRTKALLRRRLNLRIGAEEKVETMSLAPGKDPEGQPRHFAGESSLARDGGLVRVEFPPFLGMKFSLRQCDLFSGGQVTPITPEQLQDIEANGDVYMIAGASPSFTLRLPARESATRSLRIGGVIR